MGTAGCRGPKGTGKQDRVVSGMWGGVTNSEGKDRALKTLLILSPFAMGSQVAIRPLPYPAPLSPINSIQINSIQQAFIE